VSPRTHGSGLFTRGQTQILSLCTLGTAKEGQRIDDLSLEGERRYMHHYNFPPFSVGETGMLRGPKRRDIGHGALAQRALQAVIPEASSSRTRSASSRGRAGRLVVDGLGLRLDARTDGRRRADQGAGVGHPMGLVKEGDITSSSPTSGAEDTSATWTSAGTDGITALQMDIRSPSHARSCSARSDKQRASTRGDPQADAAGATGTRTTARGHRRGSRRQDQPRSTSAW
jgi:polyribonucleotide nucleotidyltransferase